MRSIPVGEYAVAAFEEGAGPPVVFVHSLTFDHTMWVAQVGALADRYQCIAFDSPGHGRSGHADREFSLEDIADDLAEAIGVLDVGPVVWVGHSMGGMLGMRVALRHPEKVRGLVLCNTSAQAEDDGVRDLYNQVNESSRGKPSDPRTVGFVMNLMFSKPFRDEHPERIAPFKALLDDPPSQDGSYRVAHAVIWRKDIREQLGNLKVPTTIITSTLDFSTPRPHSDAMLVGIPGASIHVIEDAGHMSPVERPDAVTEIIQTFLGELDG